LQGSGHGFRELRAEALNDQARALLDGRCALLDVAEALGFADGRSFARAFKSWNGITPSSYRRYAVVQR
jgi:AraC-like DNA-binding protein